MEVLRSLIEYSERHTNYDAESCSPNAIDAKDKKIKFDIKSIEGRNIFGDPKNSSPLAACQTLNLDCKYNTLPL